MSGYVVHPIRGPPIAGSPAADQPESTDQANKRTHLPATMAGGKSSHPECHFAASGVAAIINFPLWRAAAIGQSGFDRTTNMGSNFFQRCGGTYLRQKRQPALLLLLGASRQQHTSCVQALYVHDISFNWCKCPCILVRIVERGTYLVVLAAAAQQIVG